MKTNEDEIQEELEIIPQQQSTSVVPIDLSDLASRRQDGAAIFDSRADIWGNIRLACIRETNPEDWLLFRAVDKQSGHERITAYLQDSGCGRIRPLLGIEVRPPAGTTSFQFERTEDQSGDFAYSVTGDAECRLTGMKIYGIVGVRYSTDDDAKAIDDPLKKELRVKGNARASLDGRCTRALAGLNAVPIAELERAWTGTSKKIGHCTWARGFKDLPKGAELSSGTGTPKRRGGPPKDIPAPTCEICGASMNFVKAGKTTSGKEFPAFWSCPKGFGGNATHEKSTVPDSEWRDQLAARDANRFEGEGPDDDD